MKNIQNTQHIITYSINVSVTCFLNELGLMKCPQKKHLYYLVFFRETEPLGDVCVCVCKIYYKELAYEVLEAENSQDLQLAT